MKNNTRVAVLFVIVFLLFLFLGIRTGEFIGGNRSSLSRNEELLPTLDVPDQKLLLLILVEDLSAPEPGLEGVWLINFLADDRAVMIFPLLPSQAKDGLDRDQALSDNFALDEDLHPAPRFFEILENRDVSWQGYLLLDRLVAAEVIDFLGGLDLGDGQRSGSEILNSLRKWPDDRMFALYDQGKMLETACRAAAGSDRELTLVDLQNAFPNHFFIGGLPPSSWEDTWGGMKDSGEISCRIPTLPDLSP